MSELDTLLKNINKQYEEDIAFKGLERKDFTRIPFSSPRMNYVIYGGIARNTITELSGEEGSGKTTTALDLVKNMQQILKKEKSDKKVVYIDAENTLDEMWASKLGVNVDELVMIRPQEQTTEQILDIAEQIVKTNEAAMLVIDSIAVLVPQQIYEESYEKKSYGGNATALTRFVSKVVPLLRKYECTLILLNQVRQDINNPYNQYLTPGGQALKHQCSLRLAFRRGDFIDEKGNKIPNYSANPVGHKVMASVVKTKICRPDRKLGYYTLNYLQGIDWVTDLIEVAIECNLIAQAGAWYYLNDENGELIEKFNGKSKLVDRLKNDKELVEKINKWIEPFISRVD